MNYEIKNFLELILNYLDSREYLNAYDSGKEIQKIKHELEKISCDDYRKTKYDDDEVYDECSYQFKLEQEYKEKLREEHEYEIKQNLIENKILEKKNEQLENLIRKLLKDSQIYPGVENEVEEILKEVCSKECEE